MMVGQFAAGTTVPWVLFEMAITPDVMAARAATVPWLVVFLSNCHRGSGLLWRVLIQCFRSGVHRIYEHMHVAFLRIIPIIMPRIIPTNHTSESYPWFCSHVLRHQVNHTSETYPESYLESYLPCNMLC